MQYGRLARKPTALLWDSRRARLHLCSKRLDVAHLRCCGTKEDQMTSSHGRSGYIHRCTGSQANPVIHFVCPLSGSPTCFPSFGSHNRTELSILPLASIFSIPFHSTHRIQPVWPVNVCFGSSIFKSHKRTELSPDPVASIEPVGENDAHRMGDWWPETRSV